MNQRWIGLGAMIVLCGPLSGTGLAQEHPPAAGHGHGAGIAGSGRTVWQVAGKPVEASIDGVKGSKVALIGSEGDAYSLERTTLSKAEEARVGHWEMMNRAPEGFGDPDRVIRLRTLRGQMRYDDEEIVVRPGAKIQLHLRNIDDMHHNLILCARESQGGMEVAEAAWALGGEGFAKQWIPEHSMVLFASRMADPHSTVLGHFTAPEKEGDYPYVCTLPGHAAFMKGVLKVRERPTDFSELTYVLYRGSFDRLPDFEKLTPEATDHVASGVIDLSMVKRRENFAVVFNGHLNVPEDGEYRFTLASDDGSRLRINGDVIVDNDGVHGTAAKRGKVSLTKGAHPIEVAYFERSGEEVLYLGWSGPGFEKEKPLSAWPPKDGRRGRTQTGMPLESRNGEARIYRNFITGAGNRGIGVGYPGGINLAFDADQMRVALIWLGSFIDAARHWTGRGQGHQPPAGYAVVEGPPGAPFARLGSPEEKWPSSDERSRGYQFAGYRLEGEQRLPVFSYRFEDEGDVVVEDAIAPQGDVRENTVSLTRRLTLEASGEVQEGLYFRAARAREISQLDDGNFLVDASLKLSLKSEDGNEAILRQNDDAWELLTPVGFRDGRAVIEQRVSYLLGNH